MNILTERTIELGVCAWSAYTCSKAYETSAHEYLQYISRRGLPDLDPMATEAPEEMKLDPEWHCKWATVNANQHVDFESMRALEDARDMWGWGEVWNDRDHLGELLEYFQNVNYNVVF